MRLLLLLFALTPSACLVTTFSLSFDFHRVPYSAGIRHIHSPEHVSETHRLGAPFFTIDSVDEPKNRSISFVCSTLVTKHMRIRMFSRRPDESHLLFFKDGRALYGVRFTVAPLDEVRVIVCESVRVLTRSYSHHLTACDWTSLCSRATRSCIRR